MKLICVESTPHRVNKGGNGGETPHERAYDDRLKEMTSYQQEKHRKHTIDMVRLSHASKKTIRTNDTLSTLMENGYLELDDKSIK